MVTLSEAVTEGRSESVRKARYLAPRPEGESPGSQPAWHQLEDASGHTHSGLHAEGVKIPPR
eukprot:3652918-Prymnesium_polylepis.1